jgi:transposase
LDLAKGERCECGGALHCLGSRERSIIEAAPLKAKQMHFSLKRYRCLKCRRITEKKPEVLPKCLYGNRLLSQAAVMHYFHGITIGKLLDIFGPNVTEGGLIQAFHRLGKFCAQATPNLIDDFRKAPVRHADETGWRSDDRSGYAWLFASENTSILEFANSRSASVAHKVLGAAPLGGTLVVDRYPAYNRMPVSLQYCYAHLLREVEKLEDEFPDNSEVSLFTAKLIPLLAQAMKLRGLDISDRQFYRRAKILKKEIVATMHLDCRHFGIARIQRIFLENAPRLYQWEKDRRVPADNNKAERELRPTVIARKVSFGSQSQAGAKTRGAIMSILFTARKRLAGKQALEDWLKQVLDKIAVNQTSNFYDLLPKADLSSHQ